MGYKSVIQFLVMEISKEQRMIDDIMDNFDFAQSLKTMEALDWSLYHDEGYSVPDHESILRRLARKCLHSTIDLAANNINDETFSRQGPFKTTCYYDEDGICKLDLMFVVCDWDVYSDDLD